MNELYDLKERLMAELVEFNERKQFDAASLDKADKLAHTVKNLCKIIRDAEQGDGYSNDGGYSGNGYSRNGGDGTVYRGYSNRRDSMGRYSRNGGYSGHGLADELRNIMENAPDERTRQALQGMMAKVEQM